MVATILETVMQIAEQIWLKINLILDLENSELFQVIKPYLIRTFENPLISALSFVALLGIPYGLYKLRKVSAQKEEKLDQIIEEMEADEADLGNDNEEALPLFPNEKTPPSPDEPDLSVLEKLEEENRASESEKEFETAHAVSSEDDSEKILDKAASEQEFEGEKLEEEFDLPDLNEPEISQSPPEEEPVPASESADKPFADIADIDKALKELMGDDYDLAEEGSSEVSDIPDYDFEDDESDQSILDLQAEMENTINLLTDQLNQEHDVYQSATKLESAPAPTAPEKEEIEITETEVEEASSEPQVEDTPSEEPEISLEEPAPMPVAEEVPEPSPESEPVAEIEPATETPSTHSEVTLKETSSPEPSLDLTPKAGRLITRLKSFQEHLEKRIQSLDPSIHESPLKRYTRETNSFTPEGQRFDKRAFLEEDDMETIESFIFMDRQKPKY